MAQPVLTVLSSFDAERMSSPGANKSTPLPMFEKVDLLSLRSVAPTVNAATTSAGLVLLVMSSTGMPSCVVPFSVPLPAQTEYDTPALMEF